MGVSSYSSGDAEGYSVLAGGFFGDLDGESLVVLLEG